MRIRKRIFGEENTLAQQTKREIDPINNIIYGNLNLEQKYFFKGGTDYPFIIESIGVTHPDKDYFITRDCSDYFVIEFVASGKGVLSVNGRDYVVEQGDVYILPPESNHSYCADPKQPYHKMWCNFYSETFAKIQAEYRLNGKYVFHAPDCEQDFVRLVEIATFGNRVNDDEWTNVATILMNVLNKIAAREYRPEGSNIVAARAKEILDNAIFDNITIEDLTKKLFVSKMFLTREFKNMYGMSPYHYYIDKKMSQAKLMLRRSTLSVKEISEKLCFADEHYFSGFFRRKVGVTPSEFRKIFM